MDAQSDEAALAATAAADIPPPAAMEDEPTTDVSTVAAAGPSGAVVAQDSGGHVDGNNAMPRLGSNGWAIWPTVLQRYYRTHTTSNHQCLHVHSNGICVLSVAPSHPMLQPPQTIKSINYRSHDAKSLVDTAVQGKRKHGAVFMTPRDMVCTVTLGDDSSVTFYACIRASVIEVNRRLVDRPELLGTPAGYVLHTRTHTAPARAAILTVRPDCVDCVCARRFLAVLLPQLKEKNSIGDACLEFDRDNPLSVDSTNAKRRAEGKPVRSDASHGRKAKKAKRDAERSPCWAFEKGTCTRGANCRFAHSAAAPAAGGEAAPAAPAVPPPPQPADVPEVKPEAPVADVAEDCEMAAPPQTTAD